MFSQAKKKARNLYNVSFQSLSYAPREYEGGQNLAGVRLAGFTKYLAFIIMEK